MSVKNICLYVITFFVLLVSGLSAQETAYNNFGPDHDGWDYNFGMGWTVAGDEVTNQYGVQQAMGFQSTADGIVTDIWVAFFYVPSSSPPDEVTIRLAHNPDGLPPDTINVMEEWTIMDFEDWHQWSPPIHLQGNNVSFLQEGENYWLWAIGGETTWCGWCMNIDPDLTCPHTMRREGENWLPISGETASAFRVDIETIIDISSTDTEIPRGYSLSQNYPNPFNASTSIDYSLAEPSDVRIDIFNLLGQKVTTLVDSYQPAGSHTAYWDASGYPSGLYIYRLQYDGGTISKSMLLLK